MTLSRGAGPRRIGDGRRTAACLKACEGIPTELLEKGILLKLVAACVHVSDRRVREVLEELAMYRLRMTDRRGSRLRLRAGGRVSDPEGGLQ